MIEKIKCLLLLALLTACPSRDDFLPHDAEEEEANLFVPPEVYETVPENTEDFFIESVEPNRGQISGLLRVEIKGAGFEQGSKVIFDQSESLNTVVVNSSLITVDTPPHPVGAVNVRVRRPDSKEAILKDAFFYEVPVFIAAIEPSFSPLNGGVPVIITGGGFIDGTIALIGGKLLIDATVIDENTILGIAPPGTYGYKDLLIANEMGQALLKKSFFYKGNPSIKSCFPVTFPADSEQKVVVYGAGLEGGKFVVNSDILPESSIVKDDRADLILPPLTEGPVGISVDTKFGNASLENCAYAVHPDSESKSLKVIDIFPKSGDTSGETVVAIVAEGIKQDFPVSVRFDSLPAAIVTVEPELKKIMVVAPPHPAGTVDITVAQESKGEIFTVPSAFIYKHPLRIFSVTPAKGDYSGGDEVIVEGEGFFDIESLFVGALPAKEVKISSNTKISAVTPSGSPGYADVTVFRNDGESFTLKNGFTFTKEGRAIFAVSPAKGAISGGTLARIYGAGFNKYSKVYFGDVPSQFVEVSSPSMILLKTPRGEIGTVDVRVVDSEGTLTLSNAFTYYDPKGFYGGTWGDFISESLNVTVLDGYTAKPVPSAFVISGSDPQTELKGFTDFRGQITLSKENFEGPTDVTASREDYDTYTIAGFSAENVTIFLYPKNPPSDGNGSGAKSLPPGIITGRVIGMDKYILIGSGSCDKKSLTHGVLCKPCGDDSECGGGGNLCTKLGKFGRYCTTSCSVPDDCPYGYDCFGLGAGVNQCMPLAGWREVKCGTSQRSIFSSFDVDEMTIVAQNGYYSLKTRLGEVAVYCVGGIRDFDTSEFTPIVMGVKRHLFALPATELNDVDIFLNIPLTGSLEVRFENPPGGPGGPNIHTLETNMVLGSDGIIRMGPTITSIDGEKFKVSHLPEKLAGVLQDTSYTFYAEALSQTPDTLPYSAVVVRDVVPDRGADFLLIEGGEIMKPETYDRYDVNDLLPLETGGLIAVGDDGLAIRFENGEFTNLFPLTQLNLNSVCERDGALYVAAERGTLYEFKDNIWTEIPSPVKKELRTVACADEAIYAAGDSVILKFSGGTPEEMPEVGKSDLYGSYFSDGVLWFVGDYGAILRSSAGVWDALKPPLTKKTLRSVNGSGSSIFAVGDGGVILHYDGDSWQQMESPVKSPLNDIFVSDDGTAWAAGAFGVILRFDGVEWKEVSLPDVKTEFTAISYSQGSGVVMGRNTLVISPFLWVPDFINPEENGFMEGLDLEWKVTGGPQPSFSLFSISNSNGYQFWTIFADGVLTRVELPDLAAAGGLPSFPTGELRMRIFQVARDNFDINALDDSAFYMSTWKGWMSGRVRFQR